ncbi:MAG: hypothetical protein MHPSP_003198, partial [Paramarteilia canceri]
DFLSDSKAKNYVDTAISNNEWPTEKYPVNNTTLNRKNFDKPENITNKDEWNAKINEYKSELENFVHSDDKASISTNFSNNFEIIYNCFKSDGSNCDSFEENYVENISFSYGGSDSSFNSITSILSKYSFNNDTEPSNAFDKKALNSEGKFSGNDEFKADKKLIVSNYDAIEVKLIYVPNFFTKVIKTFLLS